MWHGASVCLLGRPGESACEFAAANIDCDFCRWVCCETRRRCEGVKSEMSCSSVVAAASCPSRERFDNGAILRAVKA